MGVGVGVVTILGVSKAVKQREGLWCGLTTKGAAAQTKTGGKHQRTAVPLLIVPFHLRIIQHPVLIISRFPISVSKTQI
jgi:hypothetical protein